jgi:DNA repair protein RadA/Sms
MPKTSQKVKVEYICSNCEFHTNAWSGKCPNCGEWNTLQEHTVTPKQKSSSYTPLELNDNAQLVDLAELYEKKQEEIIYTFSSDALNDFWGEGIVKGSLTLLAGEPGLGKSTLALQLLRSFIQQTKDLNCWYISGEESSNQFSMRAKRLGIPPSIKTLQTSNWNTIQKQVLEHKPDIMILDLHFLDLSLAQGRRSSEYYRVS